VSTMLWKTSKRVADERSKQGLSCFMFALKELVQVTGSDQARAKNATGSVC